MKKLNSGVSKFLCIVLCAVMLFGCGKGTDGKETGNLPNQGDVSGQIPSGGTDVGAQGDKNVSAGAGNTPADGETGTDVPEQSDGRLPQVTVVADKEQTFGLLTNYKEKNIPTIYSESNQNEGYCNVVLNQKNEIEYYTTAKDVDGCLVWKYTLKENEAENTSTWQREAVTWLSGLRKEIDNRRITVFLGEDSCEYALYIDSVEEPHIVKRDGDSFVEIMGTDMRKTDFRKTAVLANGNIVSADMGGECFVYRQEDGTLQTSFPCGWYESMCVDGNVVYIMDREGAVRQYDAEWGDFKEDIPAGFGTAVRMAARGDALYLCCPKGIFLAGKDGTGFGKVLDAGSYHFAMETANLLNFFVCGDAFYIVYGEEKGVIKKYAPAGEQDVVDKVLNIYSLKPNDVILDMISDFQNKYPDTEICYETGAGENGSITAADCIRALNTRILAGDGPDVLVLDGLPEKAYREKGILEELTPMLAGKKEGLLPNIVSAYTGEDGIYMLPLRFVVPAIMTVEQDKKRYSTLEALVEYSEENDGIMQGGYSYSDLLEMLYYNYRPEILPKEGEVDREKLKNFLELTKRFCESEGISEDTSHFLNYLEGYSNGNDLLYERAKLMFFLADGVYELVYQPSFAEYIHGEILVDAGIFFPRTVLGVNALSGKKELAQLFFKFAISHEVQNRYVPMSGYPVEMGALDEWSHKDLSYITASGGDQGEIAFRYFNREEAEAMTAKVKQTDTPFTVDASVWEIIKDEAVEYLKGRKGLGESVDAIASRIQLYLYEQ